LVTALDAIKPLVERIQLSKLGELILEMEKKEDELLLNKVMQEFS
jgi:hypothetical protein